MDTPQEGIGKRALEILECYAVNAKTLGNKLEFSIDEGAKLGKRMNVCTFRSARDRVQLLKSSEQITQFYLLNCLYSMGHDEC